MSTETTKRLFTKPTRFQITCLILLVGGFFLLAISYTAENDDEPPKGTFTRISSSLEDAISPQR
jgi:hypothetical protein